MIVLKDAQGRELQLSFTRDRLRVVLAVDSLMRMQLNLVQALGLQRELREAIDELVRAAAVANPRDPSDRDA